MIESTQDNLDTKKTKPANQYKSVYIPSNLQFKEDNDDADGYLKGALGEESNESAEVYEPLKIYEIKNIDDVGFGISSSTTKHLSFTVNGPLYGDDKIPVGGYIADDRQVKNFIDPNLLPDKEKGNFAKYGNGIFGLGTDGKLHLIPYDDYKNNPISFKRAFQNGPILVQDGVNKRGTSETKCNRSGIGFTEKGIAKVIYSDAPITFREFAQLFIQNGCTDAIYLDGGPPAGYEDATGAHGQLDSKAVKLQFFHQN